MVILHNAFPGARGLLRATSHPLPFSSQRRNLIEKQRLCEEVFTDELISWLGNVNVEVGDPLKF